jgi:hypothetical protein
LPFGLAEVKTLSESEGKMQNIRLQNIQPQNIRPRSIRPQNIRPQIQFHIRDANHAERIAGLFYYSSAAILWMASVFVAAAILLGLLFSPLGTLVYVILALICGFPGWLWAGVGVVLFCCQRKHYKDGLETSEAVAMWLGTIVFNGTQALFILNYLPDDFRLGNVAAVWNLIVVALSIVALYFDLKFPKTTKFW